MRCLSDNSDVIVDTVREQLYCGQDNKGGFLSPTYDDDGFFNEDGEWKWRADDYKRWKNAITPPEKGRILALGLPPRPVNVPNLWITGKFFGEINAQPQDDGLLIDPGSGDGPSIVDKYNRGEVDILTPGPVSKEYFNQMYMLPAIMEFLKRCGYGLRV